MAYVKITLEEVTFATERRTNDVCGYPDCVVVEWVPATQYHPPHFYAHLTLDQATDLRNQLTALLA